MGTSRLDQAFTHIKREDFLPPQKRAQAGVDAPIAIGYGQTNSQPYTVRLMLEWLDAQPGQKVLDVGAGSGWTTALLSYLVGDGGQVFATEIIPELVEFGRHNCQRAGISNATFYQAGEAFGWPEAAPYDRILVSASARQLPDKLIDQLEDSGRAVIPIDTIVWEIERRDNELYRIAHPGFQFVTLA